MTNTTQTNLVVVRPVGRANQVTVKQVTKLVDKAHLSQDQYTDALRKAAVACVQISKREADGGFSNANEAMRLVQGLRSREDQRLLVEYFKQASNIRITFNAKDATFKCRLVKESEEDHKTADAMTDEIIGNIPLTPKEKKKAEPKPKNGEAFVKSLENLLKRYQGSDDLPAEYNDILAGIERLAERAGRIQA